LNHTNYNPFVDTMTHKINEIMVNNGFSPQWVLLEKEIKKDISRLRQILREEKQFMKIEEKIEEKSEKEFENEIEEKSTKFEFEYEIEEKSEKWRNLIENLRKDVAALNNQINHFNLVCPGMSRQMVQFDLDRESKKILSENFPENSSKSNELSENSENPEMSENSRNRASIGTLDKFENSTPNSGGLIKLLFSVFQR